mgnify:CR=1 FL=1
MNGQGDDSAGQHEQEVELQASAGREWRVDSEHQGQLRTSDLERENAELRGKVQHYEDVIQRNNLWHFFRPRREKAAMRDDAR